MLPPKFWISRKSWGVKNKVFSLPALWSSKTKKNMAATMEKIAHYSFPKASLVTDRFYVQKLAYDAVQEMRIKYRWEAIEQENKEIELSKEAKQKYIPEVLENCDTLK